MHHHYKDIREKIDEEPTWFDEFAVPRYCEFSPRLVADIYAHEVALVLIACQACGTRFKVAFSKGPFDLVYKHASIEDAIKNGSIHYGDPPNIECCPAGATMNCEDIRVLEYWKQDKFEWKRVPELEIPLPDY